MNIEENKSIVKRYFEMWNSGEVSIADEVLSDDYKDFAHPEIKSIEEVKHSVKKIRNAFPDFNISINTILCEDNEVAVFGNVTRTEQGEKRTHQIIWLVSISNSKIAALRTGIVDAG